MIDVLQQAAYDTVHQYTSPNGQRGALALGARTGMNPGTLNNKVYPGHDSELTLREAIPLQVVSQDFRILHAFAAELGHSALPRGSFETTSDAELLDLYANYHANVGQAAQAISRALRDGRITRKEARSVRAEFLKAALANMEFIARLEAIAEDDDDDV